MNDDEPHPLDVAVTFALDVGRVWAALCAVVEFSPPGEFHIELVEQVYDGPVCPATEAAIYILARVYRNSHVPAEALRDAMPVLMADVIAQSVLTV